MVEDSLSPSLAPRPPLYFGVYAGSAVFCGGSCRLRKPASPVVTREFLYLLADPSSVSCGIRLQDIEIIPFSFAG